MRPTVPRLLAAAFAIVLGWYTFVLAPELTAPLAPEVRFAYTPPPPVVVAALPVYPPVGRSFVGIQTRSGAGDFDDADRFVTSTGVQPDVYQFSQGWAVDDFDAKMISRVAARGMLPIISWEPWDFRSEPREDRLRSEQPDFRLSTIIRGDYDDYVRTWAEGIAGLGYPVAIRLGHEMNGYWYPWSEEANGNRAGEYVQMWRHVHDIFTAAGATNAIWIWSPNAAYVGSAPLEGLFPGDDYVDWIGVSGYYGVAGQRGYLSFEQVFGSTFRQLAALSNRPVLISEVGATDAVGRQAEWIEEMFRSLEDYPDVIGVIWFEAERGVDWRIADRPGAARAFGTGSAADRFTAPWSPYTQPITRAPRSR